MKIFNTTSIGHSDFVLKKKKGWLHSMICMGHVFDTHKEEANLQVENGEQSHQPHNHKKICSLLFIAFKCTHYSRVLDGCAITYHSIKHLLMTIESRPLGLVFL